MPWPMPRWVISSASHMTKAVPAVRISTMNRASGQLKLGIRSMLVPEQGRVVAVEGVDEARGLHDGQGHREVAGGLGDLLLPDGTLVPPLLELGDDRREQLNDDGAGDVGHDAQAEDGQAHQGAAAEEVEEAEHARGGGRALQALQLRPVDAGHGDVGPDLVQGDDGQREDDLVAKVGDPEDVGEPGEHGPSSQWSPGAVVTSGSSGRCPTRAGARVRRARPPCRRYPRRR